MPNIQRLAAVSREARKRYGIPPKGKGPFAAESYALPMPPADHKHAKAFARAVLLGCREALKTHRQSDVIAQVRKANVVLYGSPTPDKQPMRETYVDVPAPEGSTQAIEEAVLCAARESDLFGGPVVPWGQGSYGDDECCREYDITVMWLFPATSEVVISNSRLEQMWRVTYSIGVDGVVSFGEPKEAEIEITASATEALKRVKESGHPNARFVKIRESCRLDVSPASGTSREAAAGESADADLSKGVPVRLISAGPGNSHDKNYYTEAFIEQTINENKFAGKQCYYDHPTVADETNQPERSVLRIAGYFANPVKSTHATAEGEVAAAHATFIPVKGSPALALLETEREYAKTYPEGNLSGFSIYSYGVASGTREIDGEEWNEIVAMTECFSVDLVTNAGARGGAIFNTTQEKKHMPKAQSGATKSGKNGRESAASTFLDADLHLDIRTPEQIKADNLKTLGAQREHAFKNPIIRRAAIEAAGLKEKLGESGEHLSKASDADNLALNAALGLTEDSPAATAIASTSVAVEDTGDKTGNEGEPSVAKSADLTAEGVDDLSEDDAKAELKKRIAKANDAANASTESATLEAERNRATRAEREAATLRLQVETINRTRLTETLINTFQVPETHRPLFTRYLAGASSPDDMKEAARAYCQANLADSTPGSVLGVTRESRSLEVPNMFRNES